MGLQIRQGTDAQRLTIIPQSGELIYTTDTGYVYVGDGITLGGLPVSGNAGGGGYGNIQVAAFLPTYTGNLDSLQGNVGTTGTVFANNVSANNIGAGNIIADYFIGDGSMLTNVGNIGNYGNANVAAFLPTYTGKFGGGNTVSIGNGAGQTNQDTYTIAIGDRAGQTNQGQGSIAIGSDAGNTDQGPSCVAIGLDAGQINQGGSGTAVGNSAGYLNQGEGTSAFGISAGEDTQGYGATALGAFAGQTTQGQFSVAVGGFAGQLDQGNSAVAIGLNAANTSQGNNAVAVGNSAGQLHQGESSVAIGDQAGFSGLAQNSIAIGTQSFANSTNSVSIGTYAGQNGSGANVIAIGYGAGQQAGNKSISIGAWDEQAGEINQNSIALNASNSVLNTYTEGFYVQPVRNDSGNTNAQMFYNNQTSEITWSKVSSTSKTPVRVATTTSLSNFQTNGYTYYNGPNNDGVGATMTALPPYTGSLVVDGVSVTVGDRILAKDESGNSAGGRSPGLLTGKNGIYVVVSAGSNSTPWILRRADDFDQGADIPSSLIYTYNGATWEGISWRCYNWPGTVTVGVTDLSFNVDNAPQWGGSITSSTLGYPGELRFDTSYLYVCVSQNVWKRVSLQTF